MRTVQGCANTPDGMPAEIVQDNLNMVLIRVPTPSGDTLTFWTGPDSVRQVTRR